MVARVWKGAAVALAIALGASACGSDGDSGSGAALEEMVFAIDSPTVGFDPNVTPAAQDARVMRQVFDGLVSKADDGKIVAGLADEWKVSEDGLTYTFTLKEGVKFHDGSEFNAAAVCFNLDRIKKPETGSRYAISLIGSYASCTAPDASTAVVTMGTKYAPFLSILTSPFLGMVSPAAVEKMGAEAFNLKPSGTGPFKFVEYTPMSQIVLERNEDYNWAPATAKHEGKAHLKKLTFQIVSDPTVRLGSLKTGRIQAVSNVPETEAEATKNDKNLAFYAQPQSGSPFQLYLNQQKGPFMDVKVRQAFVQAVDVATIVKSLYFGIYQQASGNLSTTTPGHDETLKDKFPFDEAKASSLLEEAGWKAGADGVRTKDGQRLAITYVETSPNREKRQDIAEFVKGYLEKVGFEVTINQLQVAPLTAATQNGAYDVVGLSLVNVDPNVMWSILGSPFQPSPKKNGFNFAHVTSLDDKLKAAQSEMDETKRLEMYGSLQQEIAEQAITLPVYVPTYTMATRGIEGLRFDAEGYPVFFDVKGKA